MTNIEFYFNQRGKYTKKKYPHEKPKSIKIRQRQQQEL